LGEAEVGEGGWVGFGPSGEVGVVDVLGFRGKVDEEMWKTFASVRWNTTFTVDDHETERRKIEIGFGIQ
jgi:hypothetical protein